MREGTYMDDYQEAIRATLPDENLVNKPLHYNQGSVEAIDGIESALGDEGFTAYCKGNALKYIWRSSHKGNETQDIKKAIWYLNKMIGED